MEMEFDVQKTINYWLQGAEYDLGVAEAMYQTGKLPYALFMGHLVLEKLLKSLVVKNTKTHAPFTHSLPFLAEKAKVTLPEEMHIKLREFMEFHFEGRYPGEHAEFYAKCNESYTREKLDEMKEVFNWLKGQL